MENNQGLKSKMNRKVDRPLGWGIMGAILIIAFTLAVVGACVAVKNYGGMTAMIVIGCVALVGLAIAVAVYYARKPKGQTVDEVVAEAVSADEQLYAVGDKQYTAAQLAQMVETMMDNNAEPEAADTAATESAPVEEAPVVEEEIEEAAVTTDVVDDIIEENVDADVTEEEEIISVEEAVEEIAAESVAVEEAPVTEPTEPKQPAVSVEAAQASMSNDEALALVEGGKRAPVNGPLCTVNVDVLSANFAAGETVTLEALHAKGLVPRKGNGYIVLAAGTINKPLTIIANDFSADAVKMIVMAGGKAIGC